MFYVNNGYQSKRPAAMKAKTKQKQRYQLKFRAKKNIHKYSTN